MIPAPTSAIGVLDKALLILDEVAKGPLTVQDVAKLTGVARPTVHRIIKSLEQHRLLVRDLLGRYSIGPGCAELAAARLRDPLTNAVDQELSAIASLTNLAAFLFWADGNHRICIATTAPDKYGIQVGSRLPLSSSSSSLVILAWSATRRLAARSLITGSLSEFAQVRRRGWAQSISDGGVIGISAPILDPKGHVLAALTLAGNLNETYMGNAGDKFVGEYGTKSVKNLAANFGQGTSRTTGASRTKGETASDGAYSERRNILGEQAKAAAARLSQIVADLADAIPTQASIPIEWQI